MKSPTSNASNCMSSSNNNAIQMPTPPLTPKTISRFDSNPYPTTFVQADTSTFKQIHHHHPETSTYPITNSPKKQQGFKLYERRNKSLKNNLMLNTLMPNFSHNHNNNNSPSFSPRNMPKILSPSLLDFLSLALSPVTPFNDDPFDKSSPSLGNSSKEDKAIVVKGFYLHPSPMTTPRDSEPQLLSLFPVTSARVSLESPS
ncbi:hypothetical protein GYH30_024887 [Glycine max]|uniref:VQ domain-containing protein n=1 Tax=Glycine max TaxID=3847 RepID=I1L2Z5_SOYBN|nr:hypothetical protein GYH30_024887 [Glycine max]